MLIDNHKRMTLILSGLLGVVALIFHQWPELDLEMTGYFYDPSARQFPLAYETVMRFIQKIVVDKGTLVWVLFLLACLALLSVKHRWTLVLASKLPFTRRQTLFLLLVLAIGPGLVVHHVFKETFDRARPDTIQEFGGPMHYTSPFVIAPGEGKSFISGHASVGFYVASLAFVVSARRRREQWYAAGISLGLFFGLCRIMQGRHFLSDVLCSGIITFMVMHALAWFFFVRKPHGRS